jgi:putative peptidoglycan binding protein
MHQTVRDNFFAFSKPMEGKVEFMYADHLGKVTVGIGCLIDSPEAAWDIRNQGAPFGHKADRSREATRDEVFAEWRRVKDDPSLIGNLAEARRQAKLVLTDQSIANLLDRRLLSFEGTLKTHGAFSGLDDWPADAQLGLFSMAWAMGPGFGPRWPSFSAAVAGEPNWFEAVHHCNMVNTWLIKRNAVNRGLFRNAAWAVDEKQAFDQLYIVVPGRRPVLRLNMTDDDHAGQGFDSDDSVSTLQGFLGYLGFYGGDITGVFDQATDDAVRGFQLFEKSLPNNDQFTVDGIVGQTSWAALGYVVPTN